MRRTSCFNNKFAVADCLGFSSSASADILRVDDSSTAVDPDGSTWTRAYKCLQDALFESSPDDEIWVAGGLYRPHLRTGFSTWVDDPTRSFELLTSVPMLGGFRASLRGTQSETHCSILRYEAGR